MPTTPKFHFYTKFGGLLIIQFVSCFKVITKKRIATLCSLITFFIIMIILLICNPTSCFNFFEIEELFCLFVCEFYNHIMVISPLQLVNHFSPPLQWVDCELLLFCSYLFSFVTGEQIIVISFPPTSSSFEMSEYIVFFSLQSHSPMEYVDNSFLFLQPP